MIELRNLCAGYPGRQVLREVTLSFQAGELLALLGPNGCGKSTLLKAAAGLLKRDGGEILVDGAAIERLSPRALARCVAYLPQARPTPDITAERMVLHGRFPWLPYPRRYRQEDYAAVRAALEQTGAAPLAARMVPSLSGGQRQKVYLAMALAQDTGTILLDEPTTYLDVRCQLETMALARQLASQGRAVGVVLHDVSLALASADRIAVMQDGRIVAFGTPEEVFVSGALAAALEVRIERVRTEEGWRYFTALP